MARRSAFKEMFHEPVRFDDGTYVVDAEGLFHDGQVVQKFEDYFKDWAMITEENIRFLRHQISTSNQFAWVKWHAGINEDGEPQNMWWLYHEHTPGRKGMKPVYTFKMDKHYVEFGHKYQPHIQENGWAQWSRDCEVCTKLREVAK